MLTIICECSCFLSRMSNFLLPVDVNGYKITFLNYSSHSFTSRPCKFHTMTLTPIKSSSTLVDPFKTIPHQGGKISNILLSRGTPILVGNIFTHTSTSTDVPPSFMATRSSHISNMMKFESRAKQALTNIFEFANDTNHDHMTYTGLVHHHSMENDLDALFYFATPDGSWVSILDGYSYLLRNLQTINGTLCCQR